MPEDEENGYTPEQEGNDNHSGPDLGSEGPGSLPDDYEETDDDALSPN